MPSLNPIDWFKPAPSGISKMTTLAQIVLIALVLAHLASFEWDVDANIVTWSPEMFHIFGRDPGLGELGVFQAAGPCWTRRGRGKAWISIAGPIVDPPGEGDAGFKSAGGGASQWLALIGPFEGPGHGAVEVIDKGFEFVLQVRQRSEVATADDLARQNAEPDFDLVHP